MQDTFEQLKKNRKSNFEKLAAELEKASGKTQYEADDRVWYPQVDKVGNGYAEIRFLPSPKGEDVPFVRVFDHGFQGPNGSWYIEKSLTTLGKQDPVSEYNTKLWNTGLESDKDKARKQKRRLSFYSNIYIVKDPANPEHEGKVFLFKYGKQIFDVLYEANNPKFPDEKPIDPFDLWEGASMKLKIRNVEGQRNYQKSEMDKVGPLASDAEMKKIWEKAYSLKEFIDPKGFKPYADLQKRLNNVLGLDQEVRTTAPLEADNAPVEKSSKPTEEKEISPETEEDEDLNFFKSIADDDSESLLA